MFAEITMSYVYAFVLIFCRIGAAFMLLPGIGEGMVFSRSRLLFAIGVTVLFVSVYTTSLPVMPKDSLSLFLIIAGEIIIGVFIGTVARFIMTTTHVAGMIIAYQMGLGAAMLFDPSQGSQGSIIGNFLTALILVMVFTSDLHHLFIWGIADSYSLFVPAEALPFGDFAEYLGKLVSSVFVAAFKISAPHIVIGLILYLGVGIISRLMPQMQVFFVLIPIQIIIGFGLLLVVLSSVMMWYLDYFAENISAFTLTVN